MNTTYNYTRTFMKSKIGTSVCPRKNVTDKIGNEHRRTRLEIWGGGRGGVHESARLTPNAREPLGGPGACSPGDK